MKIINFFLFSFLIISCIVVSTVIGAEIPPSTPSAGIPLIPMTIIGQPSFVNGKLCTQDTVIDAVIDGKVRTTRNCNEQGQFTIAITGNSSDSGKQITFVVDSITLKQKDTWSSGKVVSNFSFAITRELNAKELQAIAQAEQKKKDEENKITEQQRDQQQQQKQQKIMFIIAIIIFVIIIIGVIYFLIKRKNNKLGNNPESYNSNNKSIKTTTEIKSEPKIGDKTVKKEKIKKVIAKNKSKSK